MSEKYLTVKNYYDKRLWDINKVKNVVTAPIPWITAEEYFDITEEVVPEEIPKELTEEERLQNVRMERNWLLSMCDWTQVLDSPLSEGKLEEWAAYRQELRDFPATVDLNNIVWPAKPQ